MKSIGVVIPCRNYEAFLPEAVASVRAQGTDIQCVVVDDGSDYHASIVEAAGPFPVVRLPISRGIGIARNVGAAYLNTNFFLFLDADDWLHLGAIDELYAGFNYTLQNASNGVSFTYGNYTQVGTVIECPRWDAPTLKAQNIASYCNLWRRDSFWRIGGYSSVPVAEDWELQMRAMAAGLVGLHINAPVFEHRLHDKNKWTADAAKYGGLAGVAKLLEDLQ